MNKSRRDHNWRQPLDPDREVITPGQAREEIEALYMLGVSERVIARAFNINYGSVMSFVSNLGLRDARKRYRTQSVQEHFEDWVPKHEERKRKAKETARQKAAKAARAEREAREKREYQEWLKKHRTEESASGES